MKMEPSGEKASFKEKTGSFERERVCIIVVKSLGSGAKLLEFKFQLCHLETILSWNFDFQLISDFSFEKWANIIPSLWDCGERGCIWSTNNNVWHISTTQASVLYHHHPHHHPNSNITARFPGNSWPILHWYELWRIETVRRVV